MLLLKPDGEYEESGLRNPEDLVVLAPKQFQEACIRAGGLNRHCKANFRLVYQPSRYQIAGGLINFYDNQGNYHHSEEREVLQPRYEVPDEFKVCYVLEMWRPPEWLAAQGFNRMEYSDSGKGLRITEPIWTDGCYEGIERGPGQPWIFPVMNLSTWTIEKAIYRFRDYQLIPLRERMRMLMDRMEREKRESKERMTEIARDFIPPFALAPHTGYGGGKHLGQS